MSQQEFSATLFICEDGTVSVHGNSIEGLFVGVDNIALLRSELDSVIPWLLRLNHGLFEEEKAAVTVRLIVKFGPDEKEKVWEDTSFNIVREEVPKLRQLQYA